MAGGSVSGAESGAGGSGRGGRAVSLVVRGRPTGGWLRRDRPHEARTQFGGLAVGVAGNGAAVTEKTTAALGWEPWEIDLIPDIERPDYYSR